MTLGRTSDTKSTAALATGASPPDEARSKSCATASPEAAPVSLVTIASSELPAELVALKGSKAPESALYEQAAMRVLTKPWSRSTLFFTSVTPDEGASEAAINLATIVSRKVASALLVDLAVTDPIVWSLLGKPALNPPFERALQGTAQYDECLHQIAGENLSVLLPTQGIALKEAERLPGRLNDLLEWAEERFEWLIIVCPPVLSAAWIRWFELNADPVLLVAARGKTKKHELRKAARQLGDRLSGTLLSGTVENVATLPHPETDAPNKQVRSELVLPL